MSLILCAVKIEIDYSCFVDAAVIGHEKGHDHQYGVVCITTYIFQYHATKPVMTRPGS